MPFLKWKKRWKRRCWAVSTNVKYVLNEFNIIYPSLMIALPENEVQRVNVHLSYLDEFRNVMLKRKAAKCN